MYESRIRLLCFKLNWLNCVFSRSVFCVYFQHFIILCFIMSTLVNSWQKMHVSTQYSGFPNNLYAYKDMVTRHFKGIKYLYILVSIHFWNFVTQFIRKDRVCSFDSFFLNIRKFASFYYKFIIYHGPLDLLLFNWNSWYENPEYQNCIQG